jgi:hypothetical protein
MELTKKRGTYCRSGVMAMALLSGLRRARRREFRWRAVLSSIRFCAGDA